MKRTALAAPTFWSVLCLGGLATAQAGAPSRVPGSPPGFDYPMSMEAVAAAPANHHVLYEDDHVRLLEVTVWPGVAEKMHGHAWPSVFAMQAVQPRMTNAHLDSGGGPPVFGASTADPGAPDYPRCMTLGPQAPHSALVKDDFPQHFFRMEFKRLDGAHHFGVNWKRWYADIDHSRTLMANDRVRLIEVMMMPGAKETLPASRDSAVLAYDLPEPAQDALLGPHQHSASPPNWSYPSCDAVGPMPAREVSNSGPLPIHYYRIEFPKVDGADFRVNWRRDYPSIARGQPDRAPAGSVDPAWQAISDSLAQSWNDKDGTAWGRLFWPDALAVNNNGGINHGGDSMGARHAVVFAGRQRNTTMRSSIIDVQRISGDAAVLGTIEEVIPTSGAPSKVSATMLVQRRQGVWKILHMQITTIAAVDPL